MIANDVVEKLQNSEIFETIEAVNPGFINIKISKNYLAGYLNDMLEDNKLSVEESKEPQKPLSSTTADQTWQNRFM